ncbi:hypothetical protein [Peterkaempfera griseoplana]|uniref:hypothetical protein n=1 Tax=Peterkaempfera griseoplana TaxID=66896 RepID=UPI0006E28D20|nr:hypothetical protein [Peterkaempfera griseoplana]
MSYDIYFVKRREGQSWAEALEALEIDDEAPYEDTNQPVPLVLIDAWDRIVPQARALLGEVDLFEDGESCELSHAGTGIQLSVFQDEVSITVPYWHSGDDAARVLDQVYALGAVVERETGMDGYDPQAEAPLSELTPQRGTHVMSAITDDLRHRYGGGDS